MQNTLGQLLMLNKKTKNVINGDNGTLNAHHNIIENIMNEIINGIKRVNTENHLMYVLKIIFYDCNYGFNWMECHYFKMMNILSIVFCVMVDCELTQKCAWQKSLKKEIKNAKMQEKCKDIQNNENNKNNVNGALYFNQRVLKYDSINRLLNALNIFLINVEYCESDIISTNVQWTNMFKTNVNDSTEGVDLKLDRILSGNADNIVVFEFLLIQTLAFRTEANNYLFIRSCKPFISLLLDYVTQLFIELLLIDTIVIIAIIEMLFSYQLYALSVQKVDVIINIVVEFFEYDTAVSIVTTSNFDERKGDLEAEPQAAIMRSGIDNGIVKDGYEYNAATARQPAGATAITGSHFVNGFNSSLFEYRLQSSDGVLFAPHLNGLTVKKVVDDYWIIDATVGNER